MTSTTRADSGRKWRIFALFVVGSLAGFKTTVASKSSKRLSGNKLSAIPSLSFFLNKTDAVMSENHGMMHRHLLVTANLKDNVSAPLFGEDASVSTHPSSYPTLNPSLTPSQEPSYAPSVGPSYVPSLQPSPVSSSVLTSPQLSSANITHPSIPSCCSKCRSVDTNPAKADSYSNCQCSSCHSVQQENATNYSLNQTETKTNTTSTSFVPQYISNSPSVSPTMSPTKPPSPDHAFLQKMQTLRIEVLLSGVYRLLETAEEIKTLENTLSQFLRLQELDQGAQAVVIVDVFMVKQELSADLTGVSRKAQMSMMASFVPSSRVHLPPRKLNQMEAATSALLLDVDIVVGTLASWNGNYTDSVARWNQEMDIFHAVMKNTHGLEDMFDPTLLNPTGLISKNNEQKNEKIFLWSAVAVFSVAILTVLVFIVSKCCHCGSISECCRKPCGNSVYKRQDDDGPQAKRTKGTTTGSNSENHTGSNSDESSTDSQNEVDARSLFSCWRQWDTTTDQPMISDESEGGWNSGSGSDSFPSPSNGNVYNGDTKSLGGNSLYTRGAFDDIWSLAADSIDSAGDASETYLVEGEKGTEVISTRIQRAVVNDVL